MLALGSPALPEVLALKPQQRTAPRPPVATCPSPSAGLSWPQRWLVIPLPLCCIVYSPTGAQRRRDLGAVLTAVFLAPGVGQARWGLSLYRPNE